MLRKQAIINTWWSSNNNEFLFVGKKIITIFFRITDHDDPITT